MDTRLSYLRLPLEVHGAEIAQGRVAARRIPDRSLALERDDARRLGDGGFGRDIVLAGVGLEILELQLHLLEQATAALGAGAVLLALNLAICSLRCAIIAWVAFSRAEALASRASASSARWIVAASSALNATTSSGRGEMAASRGRE